MAKGIKPRSKSTKKNRWRVVYKESPTEESFTEITADEMRVSDAGTVIFFSKKGDQTPLFVAPPQAYRNVLRIDS